MMKIIRHFTDLPKFPDGCVIAIGNFDSVHRGHQSIFDELVRVSKARGVPSVVMTFEPQPGEFFYGAEGPARLTRFREKMVFLQRFDLDYAFVVHFTKAFAQVSPQTFVGDILGKLLNVNYVIVGEDFRFGGKHAGDVDYLAESAERRGFELKVAETIRLKDVVTQEELAALNPSEEVLKRRISSGWVRIALAKDELPLVEYLLGHPYTICGHVAHGEKRGNMMGYPTANIHVKRRKTPVHGVYVVRVWNADDQPLFGVANVGTRPTFNGRGMLLEVHILNFNRDIYGKMLRVEFLHKLRQEKSFASEESLIVQMLRDTRDAAKYIKGNFDIEIQPEPIFCRLR